MVDTRGKIIKRMELVEKARDVADYTSIGLLIGGVTTSITGIIVDKHFDKITRKVSQDGYDIGAEKLEKCAKGASLGNKMVNNGCKVLAGCIATAILSNIVLGAVDRKIGKDIKEFNSTTPDDDESDET